MRDDKRWTPPRQVEVEDDCPRQVGVSDFFDSPLISLTPHLSSAATHGHIWKLPQINVSRKDAKDAKVARLGMFGSCPYCLGTPSQSFSRNWARPMKREKRPMTVLPNTAPKAIIISQRPPVATPRTAGLS